VKGAVQVIVLVVILLAAAGALVSGCMGIRPPSDGQATDRVMKVTGYCRCGQCCSWHRNWYGRPVHSGGPRKGEPKVVGLTASGVMARPGTIAADTTLYPFGTIMYIEGYGFGRVEDRGRDIKGQHIDLYFRSHREAQEWGNQKKVVRVWLVGK